MKSTRLSLIFGLAVSTIASPKPPTLLDPVLVHGAKAVDPRESGSRNVTFSANDATPAATLTARPDFAVIPSLRGLEGNVSSGQVFLIGFSDAPRPWIRITAGGKPARLTAIISGNATYATSGTDNASTGAFRVGVGSGRATATLRLDFGRTNKEGVFTSATVEAACFTLTGTYRRATEVVVEYIDTAGNVLSRQLLRDPANPPDTAASNTVTAGYTGFQASPGQGIAAIRLSVTGNGNESGAPLFGLDDLGLSGLRP